METAAAETRSTDSAGHSGTSLVTLLVVLALWFFFAFRLIALPFAALAVWYSRHSGNRRARIACWGLFAGSLLLPLDVRIAEVSRFHRGSSATRVRLVPYVSGMPAHTRLIEEHGEYYTGPGPLPPRMILSISLWSKDAP